LFFGGGSSEAKLHFELRDAPSWSEEERLASEYAMLGFYVSGHPLEKYSSLLKDMNVLSLEQMEGQRNGKELMVAGLIVGTRPMRSRKGARWAIFTLQDMTGVQELLTFPESFARLENILKPGMPLLLKVRVQIEEAGTRLSLQEARRLQDLAQRAATASEFRVRVDLQTLSEDAMERLEALFTKAPGPSVVIFELRSPDGTMAMLQSQQRVRVQPELVEAVRQICGQQAIQMVA
jgi:DNA polymerase-3 subunit alpha